MLRNRVLWIVVTDSAATDYSDDEGERAVGMWRRVKRHMWGIKFVPMPPFDACSQKFRGVRKWPRGRWALEICDPTRGKRLWLDTYDSPEETVVVYDNASVRLKGLDAVTNFLKNTVTETAVDTSLTSSNTALSPASVLCYDDFTPFDRPVQSTFIPNEAAAVNEFKALDNLDFENFDFDFYFFGLTIFPLFPTHCVHEFDEFDAENY
ncbi:PREDICTED: pathogenesis-related genes transcriptional activator PTI6-like [Ipomoea nil]|uniref:pathogenesis-related genes transcriptional activator PTI6-like n=1 Tax=Ipomoea nil TaxID=35883 RepID=UPI000901B2F7|nr:PREDICTED: pathogenesis-related genes transcriptional activator PTI6-like [Ipomoea nil]